MPFRRLPDSDVTRIVALDAVAGKAATIPPADLPYPAALHARFETLRPQFKTEVAKVGAALSAQGTATRAATLHFRALQTVVRHFIQVLNLAIARGALPRAARPHYLLDLNASALPALATQAEVVTWAGQLIDGEAARLAANPGAPAMNNPAIADVQAALAAYETSAALRTAAKDATDQKQEDVAALRPAIDKLIRDLWDTIEFAHREDPAPSRRRKCREWGIVYATRPDEPPDPEEPERLLP